MTDEQLFRVEEMTLRACQSNVWLTRMLSETLADYRRLRELERGLREVMDWPTSLDEVENPSERKIIAIGRLLEGEG